jgi:hypothetical protein
VQASGCRVQNPRISVTVAEAAEMALEAPTSLTEGPRCAEPLGNSTNTTPSQNAIRNKKNMRPASPAACLAAHARNLAGSFESDVREAGAFFPIIEQNTPKIFGQIDKIEFT